MTSQEVLLWIAHDLKKRQRMEVLQEAEVEPRGDNATNPSLVVVLVYFNREEEASLAGSRPPSSHQRACDQGPPPFFGDRYPLQDLVQYFRGESYRVSTTYLDPVDWILEVTVHQIYDKQ